MANSSSRGRLSGRGTYALLRRLLAVALAALLAGAHAGFAARTFPGSNGNNFNCGSAPALSNSGSTFGMWFRLTGGTGTQWNLFARWGGSSSSGRQVYVYINNSTNKLSVDIPFIQNSVVVSSGTYNDSLWHALVVTLKNGTWDAYVDGTNVSHVTGAASIDASAGGCLIGDSSNGAGTDFKGAMALVFQDATVWDSEEIAGFTAGAPPQFISGTLTAFWPLDGVSSPEPDLSGRFNVASITGTLTYGDDPPFIRWLRPEWYDHAINAAAVAAACPNTLALMGVGC